MEKSLRTKSNTSTGGFTSLADQNGEFALNIKFDDAVVNVDSTTVVLNAPDIVETEILDQRKKKNGVEGIECELLVNSEKNLIIEVDVTGDAIISDEEADQYHINDMGELIYNYEL